jgi:putative CocE/NonD family hydrolase
MDITMAGSKVGDNTFETTSDGAFKCSSILKIGSVGLSTEGQGTIKDGKLLGATLSVSTPAGKGTMLYKDKSLTVTDSKGKTRKVDFKESPAFLAGNLVPEFWASALQAVSKKLGTGNGGDINMKVLLVDAGAEIPAKFTVLSNRTVKVAGATQNAHRFHVDLGSVDGELDTDEKGNVVAFDVPVQHLRFLADGWDDLFVDPLAKYPELSQATYKFRTESGVMMKTRDGVDLACDIVHPDDDQKHPAILIRTPYGRGTETVNAALYASRGYVVVTQDCRGREDSGGNWDPFVNEGRDGYDAVQWVAKQSWCDGNVGMIGGSYDGYVQWAAAVEKPPALKCIVPQVSPPDAMHNLPYDNGIFLLYLNLWWAKIVAGKHTDFSTLQSALPHPLGLATLPLADTDRAVLGHQLEFYQKWLKRTTIQDWKGWDFTYHMNGVNIPVLHISGTWDGDGIGTMMNWSKMRDLGRKNEWIVFGPWTHAFNTTKKLGDVDYGPDAILDLDSLYVRWFDTWLKGKAAGLDKVPHVQLFVTGANKWMSYPDWPSSEMKPQSLFLDGDKLSSSLGRPTSRTYTYDPATDSKVPSMLIDVDPSKASTKVDQSTLSVKSKLMMTSAPFKRATAIAGPVKVRLYFSTSAQDTDLYAALADKSPDGAMHAICNTGKLRGSYLQGMDKIVPLKAGKVYEATVSPWDFAHEFKKGHQLVLLVTSSGFPIFSRNLGIVGPIATSTKMMKQRNTFLMGKGHPSSISYYVLWG